MDLGTHRNSLDMISILTTLTKCKGQFGGYPSLHCILYLVHRLDQVQAKPVMDLYCEGFSRPGNNNLKVGIDISDGCWE